LVAETPPSGAFSDHDSRKDWSGILPAASEPTNRRPRSPRTRGTPARALRRALTSDPVGRRKRASASAADRAQPMTASGPSWAARGGPTPWRCRTWPRRGRDLPSAPNGLDREVDDAVRRCRRRT